MADSFSGHTTNAANNHGVIIGTNYGTIYNHMQQVSTSEDAGVYMNRMYLTDPDVDRNTLKLAKGNIVPNTCDWIFDDPRYKEWFHSASDSLWLTAGPGKGKTMILLHINEALEATAGPKKDPTILYFFCSERHDQQGDGIAVLRGLIYQLLKRHSHLSEYCKASLKKENYEQTLDSLGELWGIFSSMIQDDKLNETFCVIDAVDECEVKTRTELLKRMFAIVGEQRSEQQRYKFKLFGASREIVGVHFKPNRTIRLDFNSTAILKDIETFVEYKIQQLSHLQDFDDFSDLFRDTLQKKHGQTFLWIGLMVQQLEKAETVDEALDMLGQAPEGLHRLYNQVTERIKPETKSMLSHVLRWMLIARQSLTIRKLAVAMEITEKHGKDPAKFLQRQLSQLQGLCQTSSRDCVQEEGKKLGNFSWVKDYFSIPVMMIDPENSEFEKCVETERKKVPGKELKIFRSRFLYDAEDTFVVFVHHSVKEFFLDALERHDNIHPSLSFRANDLEIQAARRCIDYIAQSILTVDWVCINDPEIRRRNPFLRYAVKHWLSHAKQGSEVNAELMNLSHPFLCDSEMGSNPRFRWGMTYFLNTREKGWGFALSKRHGRLSTLHLAARFGLLSWIPKLLPTDDSDTNLVRERDDSGRDSLMHAARGNHADAVQFLLQRGAIPTYTAYKAAIKNHNQIIVSKLIEHGQLNATFDEDRPGEIYRYGEIRELQEVGIGLTPILEAIIRGNYSAALRLIDAGAKIPSFHWCLFYAVSVDEEDKSNANAARIRLTVIDRLRRHPDMTHDDLLEAISNVSNASTSWADWTLEFLLQRQSQWSEVSTVHSQMIEANEIKSRLELTLRNAAENGLSKTVKSLMAARVDPNACDEEGFSAALLAIGSGHQMIADLLLQAGANLSALDSVGSEVLLRAAGQDNTTGVTLLLDYGVPVDSRDDQDCTALIRAAECGHDDMLDLLIERESLLDLEDEHGETALHWAARQGRLGSIRVLVNCGADTNLQNGKGQTALHIAAERREMDAVEYLRRNGARASIRDNDGADIRNYWRKPSLGWLRDRPESNMNCDALREWEKQWIDG